MLKLCCFFATFLFLSCKSTSYFVVRHAEKETATMSSDVPLSAEGKQRAEALKEVLLHKNIQSIYSTNYIRTKTTAQPLAEAKNIPIQIYDPADTSFVARVKNTTKGNVLIVGHSNTVDDIVNRFMDAKIIAGDLPETQYGDLFVVKKKGKKYRFEKGRFGNNKVQL